jgi:hypothetical protein
MLCVRIGLYVHLAAGVWLLLGSGNWFGVGLAGDAVANRLDKIAV